MATKKKSNKIEFPEYIEPIDNSVYAKLQRGDYINNKPYPSKSFLSYKELKEEYNKEDRRIIEQFKNDCFMELDVVKNNKAELLWSKAWENGHSAGLSEIWNVMQDLVELIK
jgi:hypothetical protein